MSSQRPPASITAFDVIGLSASGASLLWAIAVGVKLGPMFAKLFGDFRSQNSAFTAFCIDPRGWFALSLILLLLVVTGIASQANTAGRAARMVVVITLVVAEPFVFMAGVYWPIFHLSRSVK